MTDHDPVPDLEFSDWQLAVDACARRVREELAEFASAGAVADSRHAAAERALAVCRCAASRRC